MITPVLDLDLIRCFIEVAESKGFTAASRRLHLTQSAVSLKIQRLESLIGSSVFQRTSRTLELTPEGDLLLAYGRRLLALNHEMLDRISRVADTGSLRLGVMQQFGQQFLPTLLSEFNRTHPDVELSVEVGMTGELLAGLESDRFDLVVGAAGRSGSSFHEDRVLLREKLAWVQSTQTALKPGTTPLPLVLFPAPCGYRKTALDLLERAGRPWRIAYSSASLPSIQAAIQAGLGIGVLAKSAILPGMKAVGPKADLPPMPDVSIAIYSRRSPSNALTGTFATFLAKSINRMAK
ncbi:LysR family transcriptional regulator [Luteolibacter sp. Populi]|uniref:LysR family transcriptional regulator n=1 Tax=Luteolibacter sp. Populi TaxID=3230487 RepID=UPI003465B2A7